MYVKLLSQITISGGKKVESGTFSYQIHKRIADNAILQLFEKKFMFSVFA